MLRPIGVVVLLLCVFASACEATKSPNEPSPPPAANEVHYTAIGASDAIGYGASIPCLPFASCPSGTGYVQTIARQFQSSGKVVTLMNLGIPGAVLGPDIQALGASIGRDIFGNFLNQEVPFVPRDSTVITVFAGGNDVNTVGAAIEAGKAGSNVHAFIQAQTQNFARDLQLMLTGIRDRAPQARIVVLNLPNMAGIPYASGYSLDKKRALQQIAVAFSAQINALTAQNALVVDLMCDATIYQANLYSSDGFHPNDAGYARLAAVTYAVASTGTGTPPRLSCAQMTLF